MLEQEVLPAVPASPAAPSVAFTPLLRNKLVAPRLWPGHLERPQLVRRLADSVAPGRLTYVGAPVGCGKSTLLALYARQIAPQARLAWYTVDAADNIATSFWAYVIAALTEAVGDAARRAGRVLAAPGTTIIDDVLPTLINDLTPLADPVTLIIDDYDAVTALEIHRTLGFLVEHLPPSLSLIVASRQQPPACWPTSRLVGRSVLLDLGPKDLRLSREEAARLLEQEVGAPLPVADVDLLYDRTEGWCAGLHLAALSLRGRTDTDRHEFVQAFSGTDRGIAEYLMTELLDREPAPVRTFLRRTSILDRYCAELCDHVTGDRDAGQYLQRAEHDHLFVIELDNRGAWFRYHRLLRDILLRELHRSEPDLIPLLHSRAADWLQEQGLLIEAVRHAVAAGDTDTAGRLIRADYFRVANDGDLSTVVSWFDSMGRSILQADGRLLVARSMTAVLAGDLDGALAWLDEASGSDSMNARLRKRVDAKKALLHQMRGYAAGDVAEARRWSNTALHDLPRDTVWYDLSLVHTALADRRRGECEAALYGFRRCLARADAGDLHLLAVQAKGGLLLAYCDLGRLETARDWTERTAHDERWRRLDEHCMTYARHYVAGWLDLGDDRPDTAEPHLRRALELVRRGPYRLELVEVLTALAEARDRLGDDESAAALRARAGRILARCPDHGRLMGPPTPAVEEEPAPTPAGQAQGAQGDGHDHGLTERERMVLGILAEGLTSAQMARRLHVSERTIAAHLRAIYRKIGVGNRSAATRYALDHHLVAGR
ncbi:helix-turn-helix transcriptional regulator [Dactylosporangium darangshiense]|uniref:LuxR C-terminal-related transcriptional regulator n=1 Tax=Dactylosporangium darangshiense TaxID=579108 RepID=A0ABP8D9F2_9ACTN